MRTAKDRQSAPPAPLHHVSEDLERQHAAATLLQKAAKSPDARARRRQTLGSAPPSSNAAGGGARDRSMRMTVGVRIRPLSGKEAKRGSHDCLQAKEGKHVFASDPDEKMGGIDYLRLDKNKDKAYQFDHAFGPEQSTEEAVSYTHLTLPTILLV